MPERPDLEYVVPRLDRALRDRTITDIVVKKPVVLRMMTEGGPTVLAGHRVRAVTRRLHFVCFALDRSIDMVIAPMLAGRFVLCAPSAKLSADTACVFSLDDGSELRLRDDVQMAKVYVSPREKLGEIPGYAKVGVDVLDPRAFTKASLAKLASKRREQLKVFLMDKTLIDSFGNAYADEACWAAELHPKTRVGSLNTSQIEKLHDAIVRVLSDARDTIEKRAPPLDEKVRDFLAVRGRAGQPCPRCKTKIRSAGVHGHDSEFCPVCQPDEKATSIVDWRKIPAKTG
ncbi:MAG: endonuclease VIII [Myxococcales bacterium]|nr:endonuclease VIII [Myxococcales bacterium]